MTWLVYAFLGMTIWSAAAVADRALLLRVKSKKFYLAVPCILQLLLCLPLLPFMPALAPSSDAMFLAILSGFAEAIVLYFLYVAVSQEEVSRVFSLTGLGPMLTLVFGALFLGETLSLDQFAAFALFFIGGIILSVQFGNSLKPQSFSKGLMPIFVGSLISSVFFILLRQAFISSDFWTGFFFSRIGFFAAGLLIVFLFRAEIKHEWSRLSPTLRFSIIGNQVISFSGHCFYFLALSLASAALVQAALSAQSGIIFLMAVCVAYFNRDLLEESVKRRDVIQKIIGIAFTALAAYILAIA